MVQNNEIPTWDNCDPNDPEEKFLPLFVALPGMKGAPLLLPISYFRGVSRRLDDGGAMMRCESCGYEKPKKIKWRAPIEGRYGGYTAQGSWVDINEPDNTHTIVADAVAKMSPEARRRVQEEIQRVEEENRDVR